MSVKLCFCCSCFVIEIVSHLLKVEIADFCANEMSGQFDRMDFGDLELGVCYPLLCEWVCIVYKNCFLFHRHLHMFQQYLKKIVDSYCNAAVA